MKFKGFIYCVFCCTSKKLYIGQTSISIEKRWESHIKESFSGSNLKFHRAIRKYGSDNFHIEEVMWVEAPTKKALKAKLDFLEKHFIKRYDTKRNGYNMTDGGEGQLGFSFSEKSRMKMSISAKRRCDEDFRKRQSLIAKNQWKDENFRKHHSEIQSLFMKRKDVQEKLGKSRRGKKFSEEHKSKISEAIRGERNPMFGKKHSKKTLISLSKQISQFSLDGEYLSTFVSISEIKRRFNIGKKLLKRNIENGIPVKGFIWRYEKRREFCSKAK